jgi:hypothetical protein
MGKIAVVNHGESEITLSMVRWRARRLALFWGKKLGIINRFSIALFIPKYEIAVYDGGPKVVYSEKPYIIFYYPNARVAFQKWDELAAIFKDGGLYASRLSEFIKAGHPREQGVSDIDFEGRMARLLK